LDTHYLATTGTPTNCSRLTWRQRLVATGTPTIWSRMLSEFLGVPNHPIVRNDATQPRPAHASRDAVIDAGSIRIDKVTAGRGHADNVISWQLVVRGNYRHRAQGINGFLDVSLLSPRQQLAHSSKGQNTPSGQLLCGACLAADPFRLRPGCCFTGAWCSASCARSANPAQAPARPAARHRWATDRRRCWAVCPATRWAGTHRHCRSGH
jgi:hypothetical protein